MSENKDFDFKTVLELSKIEPKDAHEEEELKLSFNKILNHVEVIKNKDLDSENNKENLEMTHVHGDLSTLREDGETSGLESNMNIEAALLNAPQARDRYFITPLIIQAKKELDNE